MRLVFAALGMLVFSLAPVSASAGAGAAPIYVVVVKGKPVPTPRRVAIHRSVTWLNNDRAAHRITSDNRQWRPFVLKRGAKHAIRFDRRGRYPYKVDGKAKGVIIVGTGGGGGGGPTTTLLHYDVTVRGHAQSIRTYSGETRPDHNGTETLTVDWTSSFSNVTLKKLSDSGTFIIGLANGKFARGTTSATYVYNETRGDIYGPCGGTLPFSGLGTHLLLGGSRSTGKTQFTFWSQLDLEEGTRLFNEIGSQTMAACANHLLSKSLPSWNGDDFTAQSLIFHPFNDLLELHADRTAAGTSLWSPLKELYAGAPFTLESGVQSNTLTCGSTCNAQEFLQLHADVKRHR